MRIAAGVCFALVALAACSKPADKAEVPAAVAPTPVGLEGPPPLKPGLWEITSKDIPGQISTCTDEHTQGQIVGQDVEHQTCAKKSWRRIPTGVAFDFDCDTDGTRVTTKGTVTGDFSTTYTMQADASVTRDGVSHTIKQSVTATYRGACPAGMKPGDKQMTINGRTMRLPDGVGDGYKGPSAP